MMSAFLKMVFAACVMLFLLIEKPHAAKPGDELLSRCVYLQQRIDRYTRLRRGGGTAARMEVWRQSRQRYQNEYRERRCHKRHSEIRRVIREAARAAE